MTTWVLWLIAAYLLGSTSFALMLGRLKGIDIREHGSGNVGATNIGRTLGKKWGILCFFLDLGKGLIPVVGYRVTMLILDTPIDGSNGMMLWLAVGVVAILGHVFPVYLKFKGGKGMATSLGALLGFWPVLTVPALVSFVVWAAVTKLTAYVGLASVVAAIAMPFLVVGFGLLIGEDPGIITVCTVVSALLAALAVFRHRSNIKRLLDGTEEQVGWAKRKNKDNPADEPAQ